MSKPTGKPTVRVRAHSWVKAHVYVLALDGRWGAGLTPRQAEDALIAEGVARHRARQGTMHKLPLGATHFEIIETGQVVWRMDPDAEANRATVATALVWWARALAPATGAGAWMSPPAPAGESAP